MRPTPDRVRQTLFNWLAHLRPQLLAGAPHLDPPPHPVGRATDPASPGGADTHWSAGPSTLPMQALDLFAGSGALGFELASRGTTRVTLVERDARALAALRALRDKLAADNITLVAGDALAVAARLPAAGFDVVFLDPPFDGPLLAPALAASVRLLTAGGLVYAEGQTMLETEALAALGLRLLRHGRAGRVFFHLLTRREA